MISLTCNHCQTVLTIDDAFAGGVCRCQHCGTIQTVPSRLKSSKRDSAPGQPDAPSTVGGGKTLYRKRSRGDGGSIAEGTGLEDLAEVVASSGLSGSGLSGSGLTSDSLRRPSPGPDLSQTTSASVRPLPKHFLPVAAAVALAVGSGERAKVNSNEPLASTSSPQPDAIDPSLPPPSASAGPGFCGVSLQDAPVVIYVLDRGNGTRDLFDTLKEVTYKSIESLGSDRKFQVIFWNNGSDDAYPSGLPTFARPESVAACRRAMEDVTAFGQSDPIPTLAKAFANHPSVVILVTGKSLELDSTLATHVLELQRVSPATKIHCIALGTAASSVLKEIATKTGGTYATLSANALRAFAQ